MVWIPTPAARALSVLQTEIGNYVMAPSDTTLAATFTDGLNDGIRKINAHTRWPWLLAVEAVTLVADTADYELATTTVKAIRHIHLLNTSGKERSRLFYRDPKTFEAQFPDRSISGSPAFYTTHNLVADGKVSLDKPVATAFLQTYPTMRLRLYKRLIYYSAAGDTLTTLGGFVPEAEDFLLWHARGYAAALHSPDKAPFAEAKAAECWAQLLRAVEDVEDMDF